jgi:ubiquinone/menaquinone biosynthesis C-methylase UbiE
MKHLDSTANKQAVQQFWESGPCGTRELQADTDESHFFATLERTRYEREPFIDRYAKFAAARGRDLLEVGVGAGTDHLRFARAGARCSGVDLTEAGIAMTRRRLALENLTSDLRVADAEHLPFAEACFDFVYSWGVIHHTPDTKQAAREILRVLRPGGRFCVMVYNRHSLLAAQAWARYALLRGRFWLGPAEVIASHVESPGTKALTREQAQNLFSGASSVAVETVVTPYDMRVGRRRFLPAWTHRLVPAQLGWFHVVSGTR